jgi:hypothetical protein
MGYQTGNVIKAVDTLLSADSTLMNLISNRRYIMKLPKNAQFPCIVIGETRVPSTPLNVFGKKGRETLLPIVVYDTSRNIATIVPIAQRIDTLLDWKDLTIANNSHVVTAIREDAIHFDENDIEADGKLDIRLVYKITTQES